jgi:uncharacterized membrane protein YkoI
MIMTTKRNVMAAVLGALLVAASGSYASEKGDKGNTDAGALANSPITLALATEVAQNFADGRAVHAELKPQRGYYAVDVSAGGTLQQVRISAIDGRILSTEPADD